MIELNIYDDAGNIALGARFNTDAEADAFLAANPKYKDLKINRKHVTIQDFTDRKKAQDDIKALDMANVKSVDDIKNLLTQIIKYFGIK